MKEFISGQRAPSAGTYNEVAANGRVVRTVDLKAGDSFPPTQSSQNHYVLRR